MFHVKLAENNEAPQQQPTTTNPKRYVRSHGTLCSKCHDAAPAKGQRYCNACHAAVMRAHRAKQKEKLTRITALAVNLMQAVQP